MVRLNGAEYSNKRAKLYLGDTTYYDFTGIRNTHLQDLNLGPAYTSDHFKETPNGIVEVTHSYIAAPATVGITLQTPNGIMLARQTRVTAENKLIGAPSGFLHPIKDAKPGRSRVFSGAEREIEEETGLTPSEVQIQLRGKLIDYTNPWPPDATYIITAQTNLSSKQIAERQTDGEIKISYLPMNTQVWEQLAQYAPLFQPFVLAGLLISLKDKGDIEGAERLNFQIHQAAKRYSGFRQEEQQRFKEEFLQLFPTLVNK